MPGPSTSIVDCVASGLSTSRTGIDLPAAGSGRAGGSVTGGTSRFFQPPNVLLQLRA